MTIHHLSHIDLDGYSSQLITNSMNKQIYFYNANYGAEVKARLNEILKNVEKDAKDVMILITDLNLTIDECRLLQNAQNRLASKSIKIELQLLDHHGSGQNASNMFDWYYLDTTRSATKITLSYVKEHFPQAINESVMGWLEPFVDVVNAIDIWLQERSKEFEYGKVCMRLITETRELSRFIFPQADRDYKFALLQKAAQMNGVENANILLDESLHKMKKEFFIDGTNNTLDNLVSSYIVKLIGSMGEKLTIYYRGYKGLLTYAVGNSSIVGNALLLAYQEFDFVVDLSPRGTMSFRANNGVDVSIIAKEWANGGGHPNASGGRINGFKEQYSYANARVALERVIDESEFRSKLPLKKREL